MRRRQVYAMQSQVLATPLPVPDEFIPPAALDKDACPKCGRIVKQGMFMHKKYCKG